MPRHHVEYCESRSISGEYLNQNPIRRPSRRNKVAASRGIDFAQGALRKKVFVFTDDFDDDEPHLF